MSSRRGKIGKRDYKAVRKANRFATRLTFKQTSSSHASLYKALRDEGARLAKKRKRAKKIARKNI